MAVVCAGFAVRADFGEIPRVQLAQKGGQVTVHQLRHTCASLMVIKGSDLPSVAATLGHRDITTTTGGKSGRNGKARQ